MQKGFTPAPIRSPINSQEPRHARVLPSFAVGFMTKPIDCTMGTIHAHELLAWPHPALPSSGMACYLRERFVNHRRPSFDAIWNSTVNVKIVENWPEALTGQERSRLLPLLKDKMAMDEFPRLTLRAVREALRMPVAETLGVLAKLEALYWVPTHRSRVPFAAIQTPANVSVDAGFIERMQVCLASSWVHALDPNDLRFPAINERKLAAWIAEQLEMPVLSAQAHGLCLRLLAADNASWADELADLAAHGIKHAGLRKEPDETKQRIFLARYGGLHGLELKIVGDRFGTTGKRVRQICDAILVSLQAQPVKMPALERLLGAAARVMPLPMEEANSQLARFLGDGCGLHAAIRFAEDMHLPSPVRHALPKARANGGYKPIPMVDAACAPSSWANAALAQAQRDCTFVGCTNFIRIAGLLALEQGVAQKLENFQPVFSKAPGFRMLDTKSGWFTLADGENSAAATRVRKLMSVAEGSVDIDAVMSALVTDGKWIYREGGGRALAVPPLHVLAELFSGWSWLTVNRQNKLTAKIKIDAKAVLSKAEFCAIEVLEMHGGVATRTELAAHIMGSLGISDMAVSQVVATSSALCRLDRAIYGIRGRELSVQALAKARQRRMAEDRERYKRPAAEFVPENADISSAPVRTMVTQSASAVAVSQRVVYLPSSLAGKVLGVFKHKEKEFPDIRVLPNKQILHLAKVAEMLGIGPGKRFEIVFDVPGRTYSVIPNPGPHGADAPGPSLSGTVESGLSPVRE